MPFPIGPEDRICEIEGQRFLLMRRGAKNSRISKIDLDKRCTIGESFLIKSHRIENIVAADSLWLGQEIAGLQAARSQTIRLDGDVAARLQSFASRHSESINDALLRLLNLAEEGKPRS